MGTAKSDAPQSLVDRDYNSVKQTINDFMHGNISSNDASIRFAAEANIISADHTADQVTAKLNAASNLPSEFPGLTIQTSSIGLTFNEASSSNQTQVSMFNDSGNFSFNVLSDAQAKIDVQNKMDYNPQLKAAEKDIADKVLTVSNEYLNGKLDAKSTQSQLTALVKSGDDPLNYGLGSGSFDREDALQTEITAEMGKYGLGMTQSYDTGYTLWQPGGKNWNAINITGDQVSTVSSTAERLRTDGIYAATGAAAGAVAFGPIGAAVGAVGAVAAAELKRYEESKLMQAGVQDIADQGWNAKAADILPQ